MPGAVRTLPDRPSLRYLKLEAKRRLADGEFATLHDAQLAIAREHGEPSWARLKQRVVADDSYPLAHLRWIIARFRDAGRPGWPPVGDGELREHFAEDVLAAAPDLREQLAAAAPDMRADLIVKNAGPYRAQAYLNGALIVVTAQDTPPHRLIGLAAIPLGERITDPKMVKPAPVGIRGQVPAEVVALVDEVFAEFGLVALAVAGTGPGQDGLEQGGAAWVITKGWADLGRGDALRAGHRFPTPGLSAAVTALAVLRLIADGPLTLDTRANDLLRSVRLADDDVTVRELLSHTGGVDSPVDVYSDAIPDRQEPVIGCGGRRGVVQPSNGGYAALGALVADITGMPFTAAAGRLVLDPLGMRDCSYPGRAASLGPESVTPYELTQDGAFVPVQARICTIPAIGGLWATPADVLRIGTGWSSLIPRTLAAEALTSQERGPVNRQEPTAGLGWLLEPDGTASHSGAGPGGAATLLIRGDQARVVLTTRQVPLVPIEERLKEAWS